VSSIFLIRKKALSLRISTDGRRSCNTYLAPSLGDVTTMALRAQTTEWKWKIKYPAPTPTTARRAATRCRVGRAHAQIARRRHRPKPSRHHTYDARLRVSEKERKTCVTPRRGLLASAPTPRMTPGCRWRKYGVVSWKTMLASPCASTTRTTWPRPPLARRAGTSSAVDQKWLRIPPSFLARGSRHPSP
jgi:hypothetical protein